MKIQFIKFCNFIILVMVLTNIKILSEVPTIPIEYYFKTNIVGFPQMKSYEDKLFLLYKLPEKFWVGENNYSLDYYENGKWYNLLNRQDSISIYDFEIDKSGNLWVASGRGLFKYDWDKWQKFVIDDSLKNVREFTNICIDSNNNIWCTTFNGLVVDRGKSYVYYKTTYSEIIKFNGDNFEVMKFREGGLSINRFGGENGISCLPDGKIFIHDPFFNLESIDNVKNDLIIFNNNNESTETIQGPTFNTQSMPKIVSKIYPDKEGNVWFCLSGSGLDQYDPGLTVLKNNGQWQSLSTYNGLFYFGKFPDIDDSFYLPTYAIYQDNNNNYWVGGDRFFGYLDSDLKLRIPKESFYEKCTLTSFDWMEAKQEDSTVKKHFYNLTHYDEIGVQPQWYGRVERITGNKNGDLWIGTNLGLLHYSPNTSNITSERNTESQLSVYPNPVRINDQYVNIVLYGNNSDLINIELYSLSGQFIMEKEVYFWGDLGKFSIPNRLDVGSYFLKIRSNDKIYTKKLIIN